MVTSLFLVANVNASTPVSGTINQNTTWTQANSPYSLTGTVFVGPGVTLTIEPGVTVDFSTYSLQINGGTLIARGASDNMIDFYSSYLYSSLTTSFSSSSSWNESTGSGSIIENAVLNCACILINSCSPKISSNYFANTRTTALAVTNSSSLILDNAFNCQTTAISVSNIYPCSPTISRNYVKCGTSSYGITATTNTYVSENNVTGCLYGIYASGNVTVQRNLVRNCSNGIYTSGNSTVEGNTVTYNGVGINVAAGAVWNNTVGNNQVGIAVSTSSANISQNNIFGNTQYNLGMSTPNAADVRNNWWGTTDASVINQTIFDNKNSTSLGKVNFMPFLTDSNPSAPALETITSMPDPTPTAIPTPVPAPTPTYLPIPTNNTWVPTPTATPSPTQSPTPSPTPIPTPIPTPKIMPGSPLTMGGTSFAEALSQFDITALAELVLIVLGIVWVVVILVSIDRNFGKKTSEKNKS